MIEVEKNKVKTTIDKVFLDTKRMASVIVEKLSNKRKYFVFYDSTIHIKKNGNNVNYSMDRYEGHTLGFFLCKHYVWPRDVYVQKAFHNFPGESFNVDMGVNFSGAVGVILFMHPFADSATVQKYADAFAKGYKSGSSSMDQMMMDYNYQVLSHEDGLVLPSFFKNYDISEQTCNEECFGMITVHSTPRDIDFLTKTVVFK